MSDATTAPAPAAFGHLIGRIDALHVREPVTVRAGHGDLGGGLWLSCDPAGRTEMTCEPADPGFRLRVEGGDSGAWTSFGMALPLDVLRRGRFVGVQIETRGGELVSVTPRLRYRMAGGGIEDRAPDLPVLLPPGPRTHLACIPLDPGLLGRAAHCELNLYFHQDRMALHVTRLEPLLIA